MVAFVGRLPRLFMPLTSPDTGDIEVSQHISAPLDLIWRACSSARGLASWQADEAEGEAVRGGKLSLYWAAFNARVEVSVLDLVPYRRMLLRHGDSVVEFLFDHQQVTLIHGGLTGDDDREGLASSWKVALAQLAHCVERHPGRQRRVHWLVRQVRSTPGSVYLGFSDPHLLDLWLTNSGGIAEQGQPYKLALKSGQLLTGTVLAHIPGRDLVLSCDSFDESLLTLRTLPSPLSSDERLVALVWSEWGPPNPLAEELLDDLQGAMDRLESLLSRGGSA